MSTPHAAVQSELRTIARLMRDGQREEGITRFQRLLDGLSPQQINDLHAALSSMLAR